MYRAIKLAGYTDDWTYNLSQPVYVLLDREPFRRLMVRDLIPGPLVSTVNTVMLFQLLYNHTRTVWEPAG